MRLAGHHALITGAGTGIGAAIARVLAAEGAKLTLVGRRREKLEEVGAGSPDALVAPADVTRRDEVERCFALARDAQGPVTILVNNAGAAESAPFAEVDEGLWRRLMAVNLDALLHCCQAALPDLIEAEAGRIVTIASTAGLKGYAYSAPYVAAKHGAVGLTRALAAELARTNVTVNAVCPGFTDTDILAEAIDNIRARTGRSAEQARAELERFNPQRRLISPEEVAATVAWLCLPESRSVTGQAIAVAGGEVT
ncbi:SDR family NAD(P)-dependent oxidoreductase [Sphingosinicella sp. CPCC 101087]|uniref:SDR family NAD(P)-dependent oxidoreductase n=1 Tax=Sphingosinicella sp. CPCC 101087 TaxID=2497754 RepID=UPI00101E1F23|nr:SDR family NAD(P)-dependent oxidoreductase [Sphingosinicella sp. CPCC 101087]